MGRLFRADTYRLSRTKGIYLTLLAIILMGISSAVSKNVGGIDVNMNLIDTLHTGKWTLIHAMMAASLSVSVVLFLLIVVFVVTVGYEFSQKTYKNTLTSGVSRLTFVVEKFGIMLLTIFIMLLSYFVTVLIAGLIKGYPAGGSTGKVIQTLLTNTVSEAVAVAVIFAVATFVLALCKNIILASVMVLAWPIAISILAAETSWHWLKYINFFITVNDFAGGFLKWSQMAPYISVGVGIIVAAWLLTIVTLNHQEL